MTKKILSLVLCVMMGAVIFCTGCVKEQGVNATELEAINDIKSMNTKADIQAALENNKQVMDISWGKDDLQVVFIKNIGEFEKQLYIWKVGEEKEKQIKGVSGNLYDIMWSPDKKYFTVNEGTSTIYETILISCDNLQIVDRVQNVCGPIWSPNSRKIAFAVLNDKEPVIPTEWMGTCDLMIYDIGSKIKAVVLEGDNDFSYIPKAWDYKGLKYEKIYLDDRKPEELIYEDTGYDITKEIHIEKDENIEEEIKYPVVINMVNKDVEKKINNIILKKVGLNNEPVESKQAVKLDDETFKEILYTDYEVTKKTKEILSIYFFSSAYMEGAAHPSRYVDSVTLDLKTGEVLELKDLFKKDIDYKDNLNSILNKKVNELDIELFEEYKGLEEEQQFYLTDNSLIVYYQEGVYTPYAFGPLFLEVSLEDIISILKKENKPEGIKVDNTYEILSEAVVENGGNMEVNIKYPVIASMADKQVQQEINFVIMEKVDRYVDEVIPFADKAKQIIQGGYEVTGKTANILSIKFMLSFYSEGEQYPKDMIDTITFDMKKGRELELKDLFKEDTDYLDVLNKILKKEADKLGLEALKGYEGIDKDSLEYSIVTFNVMDNALIIYESVGDYEYVQLTVMLEKIKDILK